MKPCAKCANRSSSERRGLCGDIVWLGTVCGWLLVVGVPVCGECWVLAAADVEATLLSAVPHGDAAPECVAAAVLGGVSMSAVDAVVAGLEAAVVVVVVPLAGRCATSVLRPWWWWWSWRGCSPRAARSACQSTLVSSLGMRM